MATATEVPKNKWTPYFNELGTDYQGWATTVEVLAGELGDQHAIDGLPLQGLSYEAKGGSQAGDILVEAGDVGVPFETHLIHRPAVVRIATTRSATEVDIEVEDEERVTTIIHLRPRPELPPPQLSGK
jgi:hypothetical protein